MYNQTEYPNNDDEFEEEITFSEIFKEIWLSPRDVFRRIELVGYEQYSFLLMAILGVSNALNQASSKNWGDRYSFLTVLLLSLIGGALFGWIRVYLWAVIVRWTGSWFGGVANFQSVLRVQIYSSIPDMIIFGITVLQLVTFGEALFESDGGIFNHGIALSSYLALTILIQVVCGFWSFALEIVGLSEVHQISKWAAFGSIILPVFLLVGMLFSLVLLIAGIVLAVR